MLKHWATGLTFLVAIAILGCGSSRESDGVPATELLVGAPKDALAPSEYPIGQEWRTESDWAHPVDFYKAVYDLWQSGIAACMKSRGHTYTPQPFFDDTVVNVYLNPLNRAFAETAGYHGPATPADINDPSLDEAFNEALSAEGGCGEQANIFAYGSEEASLYLAELQSTLDAVEAEAFEFSSSSEFLALMSSWSACMADAGYQYESRQSASTQFSGLPSVTEEELRVRRADLECDKEVGLTARWSAYQASALESAMQTQAPQIRELQGLRRSAIDRVLERTERLNTDGVAALST